MTLVIFANFEQVKIISSYFADFEQVIIFSSYFADFEQVKIVNGHFLTLNNNYMSINFLVIVFLYYKKTKSKAFL